MTHRLNEARVATHLRRYTFRSRAPFVRAAASTNSRIAVASGPFLEGQVRRGPPPRIRDDEERQIAGDRLRCAGHAKTGAQSPLENNDENKSSARALSRQRTTRSRANPGAFGIAARASNPDEGASSSCSKAPLQTFLTASPSPIRDGSTVASQNLRDFYKLIDVYLDAVFYPNLDGVHGAFKREGHSELDALGGPLTYKGVRLQRREGRLLFAEVVGRPLRRTTVSDKIYGLEGAATDSHPETDA